jgi:hypothetical protein
MDIKKQSTVESSREGYIAVIKQTATAIVLAVCGWVLARSALPFGAYPFGIGFLCSSTGYTLAVLAGVGLSAVGQTYTIPLLCTYAVALLKE